MSGHVLALVTSDNIGGGALFTLWFPLGLFLVVAGVAWRLVSRPHRRVPPRRPGSGRTGAGE